MASSLYNQLNNNSFPNPSNLINKFNEFRSMFHGDPQAIVQNLLQTGRMSQTQYSQLRQMAKQFQNLLPK